MHVRAQRPLWRGERLPSVALRVGNAARLILETLDDLKASLLVLGAHQPRPIRDALEGTIAEKALAARICPVLIARNPSPSPYRRVLLALDLSRPSASALRAAESLVLRNDARTQVVYAADEPYHESLYYAGAVTELRLSEPEAWRRDAERAITDMLKYESADFSRYQVRIEQGDPARGILRAAAAFEPDLLVMGTRGGGALHRALLGSISNRTLHEVSCDTLIVPEEPKKTFRSSGNDALRHDTTNAQV